MATGTTRNPRSVWTIPAEPSAEKHFAAYPSELVRRCLTAGTSAGGCCPACGAPWAPRVERQTILRERPADQTGRHEAGDGVNSCGNTVAAVDQVILGYAPTCGCGAAASVPCRVLDPFAGTGTTVQVAAALGRAGTGMELSEAYLEIAQRKVMQEPGCLRRKRKGKAPRRKRSTGERQLMLLED